MANSFEFFFDYTSPTAYIGDYAAREVAERTGAEMIYRPVFPWRRSCRRRATGRPAWLRQRQNIWGAMCRVARRVMAFTSASIPPSP